MLLHRLVCGESLRIKQHSWGLLRGLRSARIQGNHLQCWDQQKRR